jgi:hypothetical protein
LNFKGDGTFFPGVAVQVGTGSSPIAAGDFDGDGIPDLGFGEYNGRRFGFLQGKN